MNNEPLSMDGQFDKWIVQHDLKSYSTDEYDEKYNLARAAFEAGYKLAVQDYNFFEKMK